MYRLPNGQVWAEHEDLWDTDDLRSHAASIGKTIHGAAFAIDSSSVAILCCVYRVTFAGWLCCLGVAWLVSL